MRTGLDSSADTDSKKKLRWALHWSWLVCTDMATIILVPSARSEGESLSQVPGQTCVLRFTWVLQSMWTGQACHKQRHQRLSFAWNY